MQGSVNSSLKCSVQVDSFGRQLLSDSDGFGLFQYKRIVDIPPISFCDDIMTASECGLKSIEVNTAINVKVETKKLNLGKDKCIKIHISKKGKKEKECPMKKMIKVHNDIMKEEERVKYLGDVVDSRGSINETITDRVNKAIGLRSKLKSLTTDISLGSFYFEICLTMRESMYLNSILVNCESWYFITKKQIEQLEAADSAYFQIIFRGNAKTLRDAYYLETGQLKIRHFIAKRRLMFLHNILRRDPSELIVKVYRSQQLKTVRNDWFKTVQSDKVFYDIAISDDEISTMSKSIFKRIVNKQVYKKFYHELVESRKSNAQDLIKHVKPDKNWRIPVQTYLKSASLSIFQKQCLFLLRSRSYNVKSNMKSQFEDDMRCRLCMEDDSFEDEKHVFEECEELIEDKIIIDRISVDNIFGNLEEQTKAIKHFAPIMKKRDLIMEVRNL